MTMFLWVVITFALIGMVMGAVDVVMPGYETVDLKIIRLKGGKDPLFKMLRRETIIPNPNNPRDEESFMESDPEFALLLQSMHVHGFMPGFPITVLDSGNGTFEIIGGHRRFYASGACGIDLLPCLVMPAGSLTDAEKLRLVLDHRTTASLKAGEVLNAFRKCVENGFTHDLTCRTLGWITKEGKLNQNTYKKYMDVLTLPPADQRVWQAYASHGKNATTKNIAGETIPLPYIPDTETTKKLVAAVKEAKDSGFTGLTQDSPQYDEAKKSILRGKKSVTAANAKDFDAWADLNPDRLFLKRLWMRAKGTYTRHEMSAFHSALRWMHDLAFGAPEGMKPAPRPSFLDSPEWLADTLPVDTDTDTDTDTSLGAVEPDIVSDEVSDETVETFDRKVRPRKVKSHS